MDRLKFTWLVAGTLILGACGDNADEAAVTTAAIATTQTAAQTTAPTTAQTAAPPATVAAAGLQVVSSSLGDILADSEGFTLYSFANDEPGTSNCYGQCEAAWPPLYEELLGTPAPGIDQAKLGTTTRDDGKVQVTYNGFPLYFFVQDQLPGDVKGQGSNDVWYVLNPAGEVVK